MCVLGCTFVVGVLEQVSVINNATIVQTLDRMCAHLPSGDVKIACNIVVNEYTPLIISVSITSSYGNLINWKHYLKTIS